MKYFVFILLIATALSACSAGSENSANSAAVQNPSNSDAANANSVAATNPAPQMIPYNGSQNVNPNAFNASNDNLKTVKTEPKPDELPYGSRKAPDDSVITSESRGKLFVETRVFKSDPVLQKVEKIMDGKTNKYKIYLKNGKVVDVPESKMDNYAVMAPGNFLEILGMNPKPQPVTPSELQEKRNTIQ